MDAIFRKRLAEVRRRWGADRLLRHAADAALVVGIAAVLAVAAERAFAARLIMPLSAGLFLGAVAALTAVRWWLGRPSAMQAALALDERLGLRERFSTTLALAASEDPFAVAAREEARRRADPLDVGRAFPIRPTWRWAHASASWAALAMVVFFMPAIDLLGRKAAAGEIARRQEAVERAKADLAKAVARVEEAAKPLGASDLAAELAALKDFDAPAEPQEIRRQGVRALSDVAGKLDAMRKGDEAEAARTLQEMMKQLRMPGEGISRDLARALARGNFDKAGEIAKSLQDRLARQDLSPEAREALSKALGQLADQLRQIAADRKSLEEALAFHGLDKKLADLDEAALRDALEKSGLSPETIEKLLQQARACRAAGQSCNSLAKALGKCAGAGLSPADLAALADQLNGLDALAQQLALMDVLQSELDAAMAIVGAGLGITPGMGAGLGSYQAGAGQGTGGTGGPGQGSGPVDTAAEPVKTQGMRVSGQGGAGPIIATWNTQEEQVRGEATRAAADVLQAAKDTAAEAVSENRIPSRYHEAVKAYFGSLGQSAPRETE